MEQNITNIDFSKGNGIVPVIVQDANTKEVLTLAYSNKESLERTLSTGNLSSRACWSSMPYRRANLLPQLTQKLSIT